MKDGRGEAEEKGGEGTLHPCLSRPWFLLRATVSDRCWCTMVAESVLFYAWVFCVLAGWFWVFDVLCMLTDSPQWCWEASPSSTSSSTASSTSSRSESCVPFSSKWAERLPEGQSGQELIDCLWQAGTPSDVADLA